MDSHSRNKVIDRDENMHGMQKIIYLQKYGVKRFPYRGKRRHTPSIYQSFDGGIVITNDVFGLTIRQFERMYKDCLERRKTKEQWILNLRYPDKSSNEYIEYLQDCVYYNDGNLSFPGNDIKEKYLYEHLIYAVGTEIIIRNRQRLSNIDYMIDNLFLPDELKMLSGSMAEGLDLPGSDVDIMYLINNVDVVQNIGNIKNTIHHTTLVMDSDNDHPGFTRLILVEGGEYESQIVTPECCESVTNDLFLSVKVFLDKIKKYAGCELSLHGPSLSDTDQNFDIAVCLRSKTLPYSAVHWVRRHRHQWPPNFVIDQIQNYGCLLVPIGPKNMPESRLLWRFSFSMAEKQLVHSFNLTQFLCYVLLKLTLRRIINTNVDVKDLLCSYFLKTALFWVSEEVDIETFQLTRLFYCFSLCLDKLILWIKNCYCPNYFIPKQNMFIGKIDQSNNKYLQIVLDSIKCGGVDGLINRLFLNESGKCHLKSTKSETLSIMLDFFFYKTRGMYNAATNISRCYQLLHFVKSIQMCESSSFIIDSCKYYYGIISQHAVQFLPPPSSKSKNYNLSKRYHKHLQDGIRTDSVSGWLLYASYYYVTGQYNVTIRLTDYVISRCKPDMLYFGYAINDNGQLNSYRQNIHSNSTFKERIKLATVDCVYFLMNSPLIPKELQLEVEHTNISIPPVVFSYCLSFLCHHYFRDMFNRQEALQNLILTVKNKYCVSLEQLSDSLTILGICYEISGDLLTAHDYYEKALKCELCVSTTANTRILIPPFYYINE